MTMITSISVSALNPPFVESDLMLPYSGAEDDSRPSSKKFPFAFDSFARLLHQFRPRFGFSGARVYPDRSPTGGGAGRNTRGRVCYPKELNRSGQVSRSNAATIQPSQAVKK